MEIGMTHRELSYFKQNVINTTCCEVRANIYQPLVDAIGAEQAIIVLIKAEKSTRKAIMGVSITSFLS